MRCPGISGQRIALVTGKSLHETEVVFAVLCDKTRCCYYVNMLNNKSDRRSSVRSARNIGGHIMGIVFFLKHQNGLLFINDNLPNAENLMQRRKTYSMAVNIF